MEFRNDNPSHFSCNGQRLHQQYTLFSMKFKQKTAATAGEDVIQPAGAWSSNDVIEGELEKVRETKEVFKQSEGGVQFRTMSWQRACVIFLKINFAMSILAVPGTLGTLGAVGGALSIVGWEALNTCEQRVIVVRGICIFTNTTDRHDDIARRLSQSSS